MNSAPTIANCPFAFKCSQTWDDLRVIENTATIRFCGQCETPVHLCTSERDLEKHAANAHCVAYVASGDDGRARTPGNTTLGILFPIGKAD